jgi:hypothetical protein
VDLKAGNRHQGAEVDLLPLGLLRPPGPRLDLCREVFDSRDLVVRLEQAGTERPEIEPPDRISAPPERPVQVCEEGVGEDLRQAAPGQTVLSRFIEK